jgi:outer membrane protein assembly factor BamB
MVMTLEGKRTYVYIGVGGVCGVSAEEHDIGTLLWETTQWRPTTAAPSPLQLSSHRVFLTAGYGTGGALLHVERSGNQWKVNIVDQYKPHEGLSLEQQTPVLYNNMIIGKLPRAGGANRLRLVAYDPFNLNTPVWVSAADERFGDGYGPFMVINNLLFAFSDDGELFVYEVQHRSMKLLKRQRVFEDGKDAYRPMVYADGRLIAGDDSRIVCLSII